MTNLPPRLVVRCRQQPLLLCMPLLSVLIAWPDPSTAAERVDPYHILAIGINTYRDASILPLRGCVNDATALANAFQEKAGSHGEPRILLDERATLQNIGSELTRLVDTVADGANVVIAMAGHAARDGGQWYFLPHDFDPAQPDKTGVWGGGLALRINELIAKKCRVVLILDACNAGAIRNDLWKELSPQSNGGGVIVIASTIPSQYSLDVVDDLQRGPHGLLTASLLDALEYDTINDGLISLAEIRHFIAGHINYLLSVRQKVPGLPLPEQAFSTAATLSLPETAGLLAARARTVRRPAYNYCHLAQPVEFQQMGQLPKSIGGRWLLEGPMMQHGLIQNLATGDVAPAAPLLGADGQPFQQRYELVLMPDNPQPDVPAFEGGERGKYGIHYSTPAGEQRAVGRYAYGKYGRATLQLVFENGIDYVEVTHVDDGRLTFQKKRTWVYFPSQSADEPQASKELLSETIAYELKRDPKE